MTPPIVPAPGPAVPREAVRRRLPDGMLGDVVGLGKTLTAVATALMLQAAEDYSTLVLCPKNLEPMWTEHLEAYDINGRVVPYSMVDKVLPELKRFNLVICDESHNLRNNGTIAYEDNFFVQFYISHNEMNSFQILGISKFFKQLNYIILDWLCQVLC